MRPDLDGEEGIWQIFIDDLHSGSAAFSVWLGVSDHRTHNLSHARHLGGAGTLTRLISQHTDAGYSQCAKTNAASKIMARGGVDIDPMYCTSFSASSSSS